MLLVLTRISHANYHINLEQKDKKTPNRGFCVFQQVVLRRNKPLQEYKKYIECERFTPLPGAAAFLVAGLAAGAFAAS